VTKADLSLDIEIVKFGLMRAGRTVKNHLQIELALASPAKPKVCLFCSDIVAQSRRMCHHGKMAVGVIGKNKNGIVQL